MQGSNYERAEVRSRLRYERVMAQSLSARFVRGGEGAQPAAAQSGSKRGVLLAAIVGLFLATACGGGLGEPAVTDKPARAGSLNERAEPVAPIFSPEPAGEGGASVAACSESCAYFLGEMKRHEARIEGMAGTAGEKALAAQAAASAELAWRGCSLRQPEAPDLACSGAGELVADWGKLARRAELPEVVLLAHLVALDPRFGRPGSADQEIAAWLQALPAQSRPPSWEIALLLASNRAYEPSQAQLARLLARPEGSDPLAEAVLLAAAERRLELGSKLPVQPLLARTAATDAAKLVQGALKAWGFWHAGRRPEALKQGAETLAFWRALSAEQQSAALSRQEPYPQLDRESVVGALGVIQYLSAENKRREFDALAQPSTAKLKNADDLKAYFDGPFSAWVGEKQRLAEAASDEYRALAEIEPVPPAKWMVRGAHRAGQLWFALAHSITDIKLPAQVEQDQASVANLRRSLKESVEPLLERGRKSFAFCHQLAAQQRLSEPVVQECENSAR